MTLEEVRRVLEAEEVYVPEAARGREVSGIVATDLMSDLLTTDHTGCLVLTGLASDQAVRTANLIEAAAVVVVNGKPLPAGMVGLARELDMPLLRCRRPMFEACVALARAAGL